MPYDAKNDMKQTTCQALRVHGGNRSAHSGVSDPCCDAKSAIVDSKVDSKVVQIDMKQTTCQIPAQHRGEFVDILSKFIKEDEYDDLVFEKTLGQLHALRRNLSLSHEGHGVRSHMDGSTSTSSWTSHLAHGSSTGGERVTVQGQSCVSLQTMSLP